MFFTEIMSVRAAGFIVYRRVPEIEYLLMQASYSNNHWTPPKGHVDPGETDYETALRETREEAGLLPEQLVVDKDFKVELNYDVFSYKHGGVKKSKIVTYWLAELKNPTLNVVQLSDEHLAFKWLPLEPAIELSGFKDMAKAFRKCHAHLESTK